MTYTNPLPAPTGTRLIDYGHYVLQALIDNGPMNQGDLTEAVWGSSGRGNTQLTQILFPYLISKGYMKMEQRGRSKIYTFLP